MSDFSRRTVVRGAAWTIPVVAIAANAPAYAASTDPPSPGAISACKDPGTGNCSGYRFVVPLNIQPGYTWTITLTEVTIEGVDLTSATSQLLFPNIDSTNSTLAFLTCTATDSASFKTVTIKYTATSSTGTYTGLGVTSLKITGINPCPK